MSRSPTPASGWGEPADPTTVELLERTAAELDPGPESLERSRSAALSAFRQAEVERPSDPSRPRARRWLSTRFGRAAAALGLAGTIALGGTGLALAAGGPGQPFYGLRLVIERLTLPPAGTPARTEANVRFLSARLREADGASARGDAAALTDALSAYDATLVETVAQVRGGPDQSRLAALFAAQQLSLEGLLASAPAAARPGLEQALAAVAQARGDVAAPSGGGPSPSHPPTSTPGHSAGPPVTPPAPPASHPGHSPGPP